ncbi:hypothetical protein GCM10027290_65810 [Micromonospora sonneratiae]
MAKGRSLRQLCGKDTEKHVSSATGVYRANLFRRHKRSFVGATVGSTTGSCGNNGGSDSELPQVPSCIHWIAMVTPENRRCFLLIYNI